MKSYKKIICNNSMGTSGIMTVLPSQGLSNRLRVMATVNGLAGKSNKQLNIYWHSDKGLSAEYDDLFENTGKLVVKKVPIKYLAWIYINALSLRFRFLSKLYLSLFNFDFIFLDTMAQQVWDKKLDLQIEVDRSKNIFFSSCQELGYFTAEDYRIFTPKPNLLKTINTLSQKFTNNTIGIHIRSTDNEWAKKNSPFKIFIEKIENDIKASDEVNFFVSTDNLKYQEALLEKFGDKIIVHQKEFRRDTKKGVEDAVIDLFCLSKTSKIYGSYWSSFSDVAGRIGNIPVEVLQIKS
jgi:hypothetical protein